MVPYAASYGPVPRRDGLQLRRDVDDGVANLAAAFGRATAKPRKPAVTGRRLRFNDSTEPVTKESKVVAFIESCRARRRIGEPRSPRSPPATHHPHLGHATAPRPTTSTTASATAGISVTSVARHPPRHHRSSELADRRRAGRRHPVPRDARNARTAVRRAPAVGAGNLAGQGLEPGSRRRPTEVIAESLPATCRSARRTEHRR